MVTGDFVVLQPNNCNDAHAAVFTNVSMPPAALYDSPWGNLRVVTYKNMTGLAVLVLCYASKESLGDTADDFVQVNFDEINAATNRPAVHSSEGSRRWVLLGHLTTAHSGIGTAVSVPREDQLAVEDYRVSHQIVQRLRLADSIIPGFDGEWKVAHSPDVDLDSVTDADLNRTGVWRSSLQSCIRDGNGVVFNRDEFSPVRLQRLVSALRQRHRPFNCRVHDYCHRGASACCQDVGRCVAWYQRLRHRRLGRRAPVGVTLTNSPLVLPPKLNPKWKVGATIS